MSAGAQRSRANAAPTWAFDRVECGRGDAARVYSAAEFAALGLRERVALLLLGCEFFQGAETVSSRDALRSLNA